MALSPTYFDALFDQSADPWRFRTSWYEQRKRALTLACLPQQRYRNAFEPGCANGELSAALAERCERLLVADGSTKALAFATARLAPLPHVSTRVMLVPDQWPETELFDLIVISEFGYYLPKADLARLARRIRQSLEPGGTVVLCHWRPPIEGCDLNGDEVNGELARHLDLSLVARLIDQDMSLEAWSDDPRPVSMRSVS